MGAVQEIFSRACSRDCPAPARSATRATRRPATALLNAQPIVIDCDKGKLALAHNGNLTNAGKLRRKLEHRGSIFQTTSDTEVIVHLVARSARAISQARWATRSIKWKAPTRCWS